MVAESTLAQVKHLGLMGAILCSIVCLLIQRAVVKALLHTKTTYIHTNMPGRGRPRKEQKQEDVDENWSEDGRVPTRSRRSRQKKVISYNEESPKVAKKTKTKKNILKDTNDNEITDEHPKIQLPKTAKTSKQSEKAERDEKKVLKIKTEEKAAKVKTKSTSRKGKKKENQISDEKKITELNDAGCETFNGTVATVGIQEPSEVMAVTRHGRDSILQNATFTPGSPSVQGHNSMILGDPCLSNVTCDSRDTSVGLHLIKHTEKDTQKLDIELTDTRSTNLRGDDDENKKIIQEDKQTTDSSRNTIQTTTPIRLEDVDTLSEKIAQKVAFQQNDHIRPLLERMDDMMKLIVELSLSNKEMKRDDEPKQPDSPGCSQVDDCISVNYKTRHLSTQWADSSVQTIVSQLVDAQVQTTDTHQKDTSRDELISVQNERDILWTKCQSQTKIIRELQNDLYKTRDEFSKEKLTYQATLVSVLTSLSDASQQYGSIIARLSNDNLGLDELCKLVHDARVGHSCDSSSQLDDGDSTTPLQQDSGDSQGHSQRGSSDSMAASSRGSDEFPAKGSSQHCHDYNMTVSEPVKPLEVKLEPLSPR